MRARSSVKWTALTGVTPGRIGSSVNGAVTRAANEFRTRRRPPEVRPTAFAASPPDYHPGP